MNPESKGFIAQKARVEGSQEYFRLALDLPPGTAVALKVANVSGQAILDWDGGGWILSDRVSGISPALTELLDIGRDRMRERHAAGTLDPRDRDATRYPAVGDLWTSERRAISVEVVAIEGEIVVGRTHDGREVRRDLQSWKGTTQTYGTLARRGGAA